MSLDTAPANPPTVPVLEPGDCLDRHEFERRYDAMPDCKKAELIEGNVYMASPVHFERHGSPHARLIGWLFLYEALTPGVRVADNASNRLDLDNMPQPDGMLFIDPACGGDTRISADDYVVGAPDLAMEVSSSSVSYDRGPKLRVFRRHGVKEYLIWRADDRELDWFVLQGGQYIDLQPDDAGVFRSPTFPGLWLNTQALQDGDSAQVLATLQEGIASEDHQKFVAQLAEARNSHS